MKEITQYTLKGVSTPVNEDSPNLTRWVKYDDHAKAIEAKDKEIERLKALSIYMCDTWADIHQWATKNFNNTNFDEYPMIQTTKFQNALRKVGGLECKKELIGEAIKGLIK